MNTVAEKEQTLKEILGVEVIGTEIQRLLDSGRFPVSNHYDMARNVLHQKFKESELLSRGDISGIFRETIPVEEQKRQNIIGALLMEFTYNSEDILNEILTSNDPAVLKFYQKAKAITSDFWAYNYQM